MKTNKTILIEIIERLEERNREIEERKYLLNIMESLGVEVL